MLLLLPLPFRDIRYGAANNRINKVYICIHSAENQENSNAKICETSGGCSNGPSISGHTKMRAPSTHNALDKPREKIDYSAAITEGSATSIRSSRFTTVARAACSSCHSERTRARLTAWVVIPRAAAAAFCWPRTPRDEQPHHAPFSLRTVSAYPVQQPRRPCSHLGERAVPGHHRNTA